MIQISYILIVGILLQEFLLKKRIIAFLMVLIKPIELIKNRFYLYFEAKKYELSFNGQVCSLMDMLNDEFDSTERRIYITDAEQLTETFIFNTNEENEETFIFNNDEIIDPEEQVYLYNDEEFENDNDFTVVVPEGLAFDETYMKSLINKYKIAGVRYNIIEL